jgi:NADH:ubiquinone oxidoreductase subunit 1 (chain H)
MIEYLTSQTFLLMILKMLIVFGGLMGAFAYLSLVERRVMAFVQMRPGPNRVGPFGLLQPIADGLKFRFQGTGPADSCK